MMFEEDSCSSESSPSENGVAFQSNEDAQPKDSLPIVTGHFYGPELPPSTSPLDHVPTPILNGITDHMGNESIAWAVRLKLDVHRKGNDRNDLRIFSTELKNMSLVDWTFRNNVLGRQVVNTLSLRDPDHIRNRDQRFSPNFKRYFRSIAFLQPEEKGINNEAWAKARNDLLESLTSAEAVDDLTGELVRFAHVLPPSVRTLRIVLQPGAYTALPLNISSLEKLSIEPDKKTLRETWSNTEASEFATKVHGVCKNLEKVEILHISLPGLSTCPCSHSRRFAKDEVYSYMDVLPLHLGLSTLKLEVPFCSITPGGSRESHWWGYLGWLFTTELIVTDLQICMTWLPSTIMPGLIDLECIRQNMGLIYEVKHPNNTLLEPEVPGDTVDAPMRQFCESLMRGKPLLRSITFVLKARSPMMYSPDRFREVKVTRLEKESVDGPFLHFDDQIDTEKVVEVYRDITDILKFDYQPPHPHDATDLESDPWFDPNLVDDVRRAKLWSAIGSASTSDRDSDPEEARGKTVEGHWYH